MKKKAVIALLATVLVFGATAQAEDAYDDGGILDPENPVTLTVWHYYNGVHQAAFDKLVEEFNGTVGKDLGIYVEETSKGSVSDLESAIQDAVNTEVGAEDIPDVFSTYTDSAYVLQKDGVLTDLTQYFTQEELDQYVDAYVQEGLWKIMN